MKHLKLLFSALSLLSFSSLQAADTPPEIKIGDQARDFTLNSANNKSISLSDYEGKNIVLVFGRSHRWPFCMKQLVQLQEKKAEFQKMGISTIYVFREESKGPAGAQIAATKSGFSPILLDTPADKTITYSQGDFSTYLIGKDGKIKAEISGSKTKRPTAKVILAKAKEVFSVSK